jgi:hypothetical protein
LDNAQSSLFPPKNVLLKNSLHLCIKQDESSEAIIVQELSDKVEEVDFKDSEVNSPIDLQNTKVLPLKISHVTSLSGDSQTAVNRLEQRSTCQVFRVGRNVFKPIRITPNQSFQVVPKHTIKTVQLRNPIVIDLPKKRPLGELSSAEYQETAEPLMKSIKMEVNDEEQEIKFIKTENLLEPLMNEVITYECNACENKYDTLELLDLHQSICMKFSEKPSQRPRYLNSTPHECSVSSQI